MPLDRDLLQSDISPLVLERNIAGQPGGGPLAPLKDFPVELARRFRAYASDDADGAGRAVISFGGPNSGFAWLVERITVRGPVAGSAVVYVNQEAEEGVVDFTTSLPNVADETSPIYVPGGRAFLVVFAGVGAGTVCHVTIQARVVREG